MHRTNPSGTFRCPLWAKASLSRGMSMGSLGENGGEGMPGGICVNILAGNLRVSGRR